MFKPDPDDTQTDLSTGAWAPSDASSGPTDAQPAPIDAPPAASDAPPAFVPAPVEPVRPAPAPGVTRSSGGGARTIVTAAVLSAILASGATVGVLDVTGALNRPAGNGGAGSPTGTHQAVTIDESSAVIDVAAKAGPAVVQITASGTSTDQLGGTIPESGVGSGIIFDAGGWILTNRHVVQTSSGKTASRRGTGST